VAGAYHPMPNPTQVLCSGVFATSYRCRRSRHSAEPKTRQVQTRVGIHMSPCSIKTVLGKIPAAPVEAVKSGLL
jgi:hypothetical protein